MKQYAGQFPVVTLPVLAVDPTVGDIGGILPAYIDGFRPSAGYVRVVLTGGTSVALTLWVHDAQGWSIAAQTGNLGVLGGQLLGPEVYAFPVDDIGAFDHALLVTSNNTGPVVVTSATLQMLTEKGE